MKSKHEKKTNLESENVQGIKVHAKLSIFWIVREHNKENINFCVFENTALNINLENHACMSSMD